MTPFAQGLFAGVLLMIGGQAIHWFATPGAHADATLLRQTLVVIQAVAGFGGAAVFMVRNRRPARVS